MLILILINIVFIVYIYLKYYKISADVNSINNRTEEEEPLIVGYIYDGGFNNNFDLTVAEIIELNIKGYIKIDYTDKYNYTITQIIDINSDEINKYEILMLNFLFHDKMQITKTELEEKLSNTFSSYNTQVNEIEDLLNKQLIKEKILDEDKKKKLAKIRKIYIRLSIILTAIACFLGVFGTLKISMILMYIFFLAITISIVQLMKIKPYTIKGQLLKYNIDNYRKGLEDKEFLVDRVQMKDIVLNNEFAYSIALHINTQAKNAFVYDQISKSNKELSKKITIAVFTFFAVTTIIALILAVLSSILPRELIFWLYLVLVLSVAGVADVTLGRNK